MVSVGYSVTGTDAVKRHLDEMLSRLKDNGPEGLTHSLAEKGRVVAENRFNTAQYDGTNDVQVLPPFESGQSTILRAEGDAVAFIEFGTGVHYTEQHPQALELGMIRGGYGYHLGNLDAWRYHGEPGTNGVEIPTPMNHSGAILTHGNPPARAMYEASKEIRNNIGETAREVLRR